MDSNSNQPAQNSQNVQGESKFINKNHLIVKIPANVKNPKKALEMLGGKEKVLAKFSKDEDLELNLFNKKINLEKCLNNDVLLRRKRMKNGKGDYKYKYQIVSKVDSMYDYFAMHDFLCLKENSKETSIDNLESKIIFKF